MSTLIQCATAGNAGTSSNRTASYDVPDGHRVASRRMRRNMAAAGGTVVANAAILAVSYPVYLHFLGYEQYGLWLVLATVLTFLQLGNLGLSAAVAKFVAEQVAAANMDAARRYVATATFTVWGTGLLAIAAVTLSRGQIATAFGLSGENAAYATRLLPMIGIACLLALTNDVLYGTLSGLGRLDLANYAQTLVRVIAVSVSVVLLWRGIGVTSLLIGNLLGYAGAQLLCGVHVRRHLGARIARLSNWHKQSFLELVRFGGGMMTGSLINLMLNPLNKIILSRSIGLASIPVYEIALNTNLQLRGLNEAPLRALMPEISMASTETGPSRVDRMAKLYKAAFRSVCGFGLGLYLLAALFATPALQLWLGHRFVPMLPPLFRILLVGTFVSLLSVPAYYLLVGLGRIRQVMLGYVLQSGTNLAVLAIAWICGIHISERLVASAVASGMIVAAVYLLSCGHQQLRGQHVRIRESRS
ncbi:MAG TPA: oligosaccharide flippase family protein [Tepidisphaeraceae bacterium]